MSPRDLPRAVLGDIWLFLLRKLKISLSLALTKSLNLKKVDTCVCITIVVQIRIYVHKFSMRNVLGNIVGLLGVPGRDNEISASFHPSRNDQMLRRQNFSRDRYGFSFSLDLRWWQNNNNPARYD